MRYHFEKNFRTQHKQRAENLKNIYRLNKIPSDTQLRDVLDKVDHLQYRQIFKKLFSFLQRAKTLELFEFIKLNNNPYYLMAVDGTGYFRSEKIKCDCCIVSEHTNEHGEITLKYGHNMLGASIVNPKQAQVIPFYPEAIIKQDGTSKNDCEQNSFRRFLKNFKKDHPKLKIIFILDARYANGPVIRLLREHGYEFIIAVKNTKSLLFLTIEEGIKTGETILCEREYTSGQKILKVTKLNFKFRNNARLHQDKESPFINYVEVREETAWINTKGENKKEVKQFSFITDIEVTKNNVEKISEGGRARWKIENETFNTLKNRGYHFEHNFGH